MSDRIESSTNKIPRLQGSKGFATWRIYVMEMRWKDGVLYVLSECPPDPATSTNAAVTKLKKDDEKARPHIVLNVGDEPATLITSFLLSTTTTRQVWQRLTDSYMKDNIQSKLNLRTKLHSIKYKYGEDLQKLFTELEESFVDLAALNDPVEDKDKVGVLLRCLPNSFGFIALVADANNMYYDSICALLKSEVERRVSDRAEQPINITTPAARMGKTNTSARNKRTMECWYCHKKGHTRNECRLRIRDERIRKHRKKQNNGSRSKKKRYQKDDLSSESESSEEEDQNNIRGRHNTKRRATGFMAQKRKELHTSDDKSQNTWLDCGTNDHFIWDRSVFVTYKEVQQSIVKSCVGSSKIIGEGNVRFQFGDTEVVLTCKHTPDFDEHVVSLSKFLRSYHCEFESDDTFMGCLIYNKERTKEIYRSVETNGLYPLPKPVQRQNVSRKATSTEQTIKWHRILGHICSEHWLKLRHVSMISQRLVEQKWKSTSAYRALKHQLKEHQYQNQKRGKPHQFN